MQTALNHMAEERGNDHDRRRPLDQVVPRATRRLQSRLVLMTGDLVSLALGICCIAAIRHGRLADDETLGLLIVGLPMYGVIAFHNQAYGHVALEHWSTGLRRAFLSLGIATFVLLGVGFALKVSSEYSRIIICGGVACAAILLVVTRYGSRLLVRLLLPGGTIDVALLVDGERPPCFGGARTFNAATLHLRPLLDSPEMLDRIGKVLRGCDRVVLSCPVEHRQVWATALKGLGKEVQILMPELDGLGLLGMARLDDQLVGVIARGPLRMSDMILKRSFDVVFVLFCLPVIGVMTALVAVAIKLDDGGPVFFRQNRIGLGNRIFSMLKFRSMRVDRTDGSGTVSTARDDDRVTAVGRWLRRTSLDELPQLFNVLRGDMSVVGPRPHALRSTAENALFWDADNRYWLRHAVKPGLTGLAQVRGFRGATIRTSDLTNRIQADLEYMVGWSLLRDLRILAGTLKVLLHPNAF